MASGDNDAAAAPCDSDSDPLSELDSEGECEVATKDGREFRLLSDIPHVDMERMGVEGEVESQRGEEDWSKDKDGGGDEDEDDNKGKGGEEGEEGEGDDPMVKDIGGATELLDVEKPTDAGTHSVDIGEGEKDKDVDELAPAAGGLSSKASRMGGGAATLVATLEKGDTTEVGSGRMELVPHRLQEDQGKLKVAAAEEAATTEEAQKRAAAEEKAKQVAIKKVAAAEKAVAKKAVVVKKAVEKAAVAAEKVVAA
ncbi:hypothetical protein FRC08_014368 [Ceratobasidium sp. 394]|nr:hypothetical protein FRC08_014368 [Ceratobasidium sp. 394]